ncbi:MAG: TonB-dependent receptor [Treponema sp.]|jgi:vitamin B12 transporter|nr:TonB-dependent receptor [Treponema sp.]
MNRLTLPVFLCLGGILSVFAQEIPASGGDYPFSEGEGRELPLMEGEGITITGTRERSQQMKTITREEIERANAPDLAALLEETAGLGTARYGPRGSQGDINLRGFDSERVAFLIDGLPANSPSSGEFDFNRIDLHSVERIEVIYGGSDSRYNVSGALGGVINIVTVKKQNPGLRVSAALSNLSALPGSYYKPLAGNQDPRWEDLLDAQNITVSLGMGLKHLSWTASWFGNRAANHFLYQDPYGRKRRKENSEVWDTGFSASLVGEFQNLSKLILNSSLYWGDKNIPEHGYAERYHRLRDFSSRENILWEMPRAFHDSLGMEASVSHSMERTDYKGSGSGFHSFMGINRWAWYPFSSLTLRAGGDYRYARVETGTSRGRHDGGLYLAAEWQPAEGFTLIPSIKGAAASNGPVVPVPKLGLLWKPHPSVTVKNNYFRSFKFPDFQDLHWEDSSSRGDPDLKPEDGWGADVGAAWTGKAGAFRLGLEGNGFVQWYDNSIHWYMSGGTWKPQNVGGAFFCGADLRGRAELRFSRGPFSSLVFSPSFQYMMSWLLAYGYTFESDKRIPYMPVYSGGAQAELIWKGGSLSISGRWEGRRTAEDFVMVLDPSFLLTVNASQKLGKNLAVFAVIRNALNYSYQSFKDYPMPGITLTMGMRLNCETSPKGKDGG